MFVEITLYCIDECNHVFESNNKKSKIQILRNFVKRTKHCLNYDFIEYDLLTLIENKIEYEKNLNYLTML